MAEAAGFAVVRDLVGHGVGREIHEDPPVPNFGEKGSGVQLEAGMTIAIEPMVVTGEIETLQMDDGWTFVTADGGLSAHAEHTVLVTENGHEILTEIDEKE